MLRPDKQVLVDKWYNSLPNQDWKWDPHMLHNNDIFLYYVYKDEHSGHFLMDYSDGRMELGTFEGAFGSITDGIFSIMVEIELPISDIKELRQVLVS